MEIPCLDGSLDAAFVERLRKISWDDIEVQGIVDSMYRVTPSW